MNKFGEKMSSSFNKRFIGFYEWEGSPCRVIEDEAGTLKAEIYIPGKGYADAKLDNVIHLSRAITQEEFKSLVIELGHAGRRIEKIMPEDV